MIGQLVRWGCGQKTPAPLGRSEDFGVGMKNPSCRRLCLWLGIRVFDLDFSIL